MKKRHLRSVRFPFALLIVASSLIAHGGEKPALTAMQPHAEAFVDMLSGRLAPEAFIEIHMSPEFIEKRGLQRGGFIFNVLAQRYRGGPAKLESVAAIPDGVAFRVSNEDNEWAEYELLLQPGDPQGRIGGFNARIIPTPLGDQLAGLSTEEIVVELDRFLTEKTGQDAFSGSVVLAHDGKVLYEKAFGLARRDNKTVNTPETVFNLASTTKLFTGLAICQLAESGKLSYEANVGAYLPDLPNERLRQEVTVEQLLTHTSGLAANTLIGPHGSAGGSHQDIREPVNPEAESLEERVNRLAAQPLTTEPGASYVYSNTGPLLLGLIIEAITGTSYEKYLAENVLKPAGMSTAGFQPDASRELTATGYRRSERGDWEAATGMLPGPGAPSAGLWASARDLLAFAGAVNANSLVKPETLDEMTRGKVKVGEQESYAYGWMDKQVNGMRYFGHTGNLPGWSSDFSIMPDTGYTLIVLCNGDGMAAPAADRVRHMLSRSATEPTGS